MDEVRTKGDDSGPGERERTTANVVHRMHLSTAGASLGLAEETKEVRGTAGTVVSTVWANNAGQSREKARGSKIGEGQDGQSMLDPKGSFLTGVPLGEVEAESNRPIRHADSRNVVAETLMTMDLPRINFLRKEIRRTRDGLDRISFILTMGTCAVGDLSDPFRFIDDMEVVIVADFCELFAQVDVNCNGAVNWDELSSFMIEMGMKGWGEGGVRMPAYAYAGRVDAAQPTLAADQIDYFAENDTVAVLEANVSFFRVYNADSMQLRRQYDVNNIGGSARALCYCNATGHYVLATSASRVCFYDEVNGSAWKAFSAPSVPICMTYIESHDMLVAGDTIGNMFWWKVEDVRKANIDDGDSPPHDVLGGLFKIKRNFVNPDKEETLSVDGGHTDAVLSILTLADTGLLASCGMDRTVRLWDLTTLSLRNTLVGHPKGVRHMTYCPDHRLIVSGGFCYDLVINNPYVSGPISRLHGHSSPIVGVEHVVGTPQVISADADGACKLWDLRTFSCVETFTFRNAGANKMKTKKRRSSSGSAATREPVLACMTVTPSHKRVLVGGRTVDSFEVLRDEREDLTDDTVVLAAWFNNRNLTFVTASAWAVKIWDGATGKLLSADARISPRPETPKGELTSMCLGMEGRRFIVGDTKGHIKVFNNINHVEQKSYCYSECTGKAHEGEVRILVSVEEYTLLISASGDRSIAIHDDSKRDNGGLLRRITHASWSEITALRYSSHLGLIASGSTDGSIQLWNFELGRHEGCCLERHRYPVTCLAFLDPFPVLLSADSAGFLAMWALPQARFGLRFKRIFTWINKQPLSNRVYGGGGGADGQMPMGVTALQCQVEMISSSIAMSAVTSSAAISSSLEDKLLMNEDQEHSLELSLAESDQNPKSVASASSFVGEGEASGGGGDDDKKRGGEGATGETGDGAPDVSPGDRAVFLGGDGDGGGGAEPSAGTADHTGSTLDGGSFQEHLAATLRKYQGDRKRYAQSQGPGRSEKQVHQVHWNTDMLSYTLYVADDAGRVTTWDLKPLLLNLIHRYGGHDLPGHGVGVIRAPVIYSDPFRNTRWNAESVMLEQRSRLECKAALDWIADIDNLGLHRIGSWEAHIEPIVCLNLVDDPPTVLTSAMDRLVKLWSPAGDPRGVLRLRQDPETPWTFRVNRQAQEDRKLRAAEEVILSTRSSHARCGLDKDTVPRKQQHAPRRHGGESSDKCDFDSSEGFARETGVGRYDENLLGGKEAPRPRQYADEELDRYGKATRSKLSIPQLELIASGRRTPQRVPVRPNTSGRGVGARRAVSENARSSPRTVRGQLIVSQSLSAR